MGNMLHPRRRLSPRFHRAPFTALKTVVVTRSNVKLAGTASVSYQFSDTSPSLLRFFARIRRSAVAPQVGTGSAQIRCNIAPNKRRVR
jgi:hypothetical protein